MKLKNRVDICGKIENVRILRCKSAKRAQLCVTTEEFPDNIVLPVTVWESKAKSNFDYLTIGTTIHVVGKVREKNQATAYNLDKTVRDIVASRVEIM